MRLLSDSTSNTKLRKSELSEFRIVSLQLSPADEAETGKTNCPQSTEGCRAACVGGPDVGMAQVFSAIMAARKAKTLFLQTQKAEFLRQLGEELDRERRLAHAAGRRLVARLNTFSDVPWETSAYGEIPQSFADVVFYDYTKLHSRVISPKRPANLHLVGSWSERPEHQERCAALLHAGHNVAIPFATDEGGTGWRAYSQKLPKRHQIGVNWFEVYDGDESDLRFMDPGPTGSGRGRIIGLRLKAGNYAAREAALAAGFAVVK